MDNYSLDDVKRLVENNNINFDILKRIIESATRRVEIFMDDDDLNVLKYISSLDFINEELKKNLDDYIKKVNDFKNNESPFEKEINKTKFDKRYVKFCFILGVLLLIISIVIVLF